MDCSFQIPNNSQLRYIKIEYKDIMIPSMVTSVLPQVVYLVASIIVSLIDRAHCWSKHPPTTFSDIVLEFYSLDWSLRTVFTSLVLTLYKFNSIGASNTMLQQKLGHSLYVACYF